VVVGAGGHAGIWQPEFGSDRGDNRLGTVTTGHRQPVRAALDRTTYEHLEVVARL
jgi:hypothetical protein